MSAPDKTAVVEPTLPPLPLTPGMFGHEFDGKKARFGISCGQGRCHEEYHNAGWYNKYGEKLGWGDLSNKDLEQIKDELQPGEIFVILGEGDSFWNFVTKPSIVGAMAARKPQEQNPGVKYISEHACCVIVPGRVHKIYWDDTTLAKKLITGQ